MGGVRNLIQQHDRGLKVITNEKLKIAACKGKPC